MKLCPISQGLDRQRALRAQVADRCSELGKGRLRHGRKRASRPGETIAITYMLVPLGGSGDAQMGQARKPMRRRGFGAPARGLPLHQPACPGHSHSSGVAGAPSPRVVMRWAPPRMQLSESSLKLRRRWWSVRSVCSSATFSLSRSSSLGFARIRASDSSKRQRRLTSQPCCSIRRVPARRIALRSRVLRAPFPCARHFSTKRIVERH
jgi:hypothetical protein